MNTQQSFQFLRLERDGATAIVTMNRPEKRNALSLEFMRELIAAFSELGGDRTVFAIVLRAEGPAFSAGHDLRELQCGDAASYTEIFDTCVTLMTEIQRIPQPVIAEVATVATAAGCQLVATCDLAVASTEAKFATPGVKIGLFCTTPMVALTRAIGRKRAMEMLLTGDFIDARTAAEWGLVNHVVPPEQLHEQAMNLAQKVTQASRAVVTLGKQAFYKQIDMDQARAYEYAKNVMTQNALEADAQEGIAAFLERRPASWRT
ncbi:MAG TPA: enoyl-CoA hydratase [Candidatus Baltobacteraceae bacterium]|jgi:enoyl-CoA hydratase/carnithine racemase|nr:enoyl-CoA hydratase [Candidatus Baltobacteraceae bacterium]